MTARQPITQLRGLWVDAFGPGFKTPQQIDRLVADARALGVNALFAQVGKRGDCYCNLAAMPRTDDPEVPPGFDPLADLINKAHAAGLQVHAWIITTAVVNVKENPHPSQSDHVFNTHGLTAQGNDNWLMSSAGGETQAGNDYLLDPGNPAAADYIAEMYFSVVRNYDVDGVQLDRVRYPDTAAGVPDWGYNPAALARYRAETNAQGIPAPSDPLWVSWRRQQITNLVRRIYLGVKAIRPQVWVDAATITYGPAPRTQAGFARSRAYGEVLQDWPAWLRGGILDLAVMMNYKREETQASAFDGWNAFARKVREGAGGKIAAGSAMYLNSEPGSVDQARRALAAGLDGWVGYSYRTPDTGVDAGTRLQADVLRDLTRDLTSAGGAFEQSAEWGHPSAGNLRAVQGRVEAAQGTAGGRSVELVSNGHVLARTTTDGGGRYGFAAAPRGAFEVRVRGADPLPAETTPGSVTELPVVQLP